MRTYLDFEKPVAELEAKIEELRAVGDAGDSQAISEEISRLDVKAALELREL
jgi:acetyl-CoA carboxylase carboxyl transferase subunit alpha